MAESQRPERFGGHLLGNRSRHRSEQPENPGPVPAALCSPEVAGLVEVHADRTAAEGDP